MSYPDYTAREIRRNEKDAALFASVGLGWLSRVAARKAEALRVQNTNNKNPKS